MCRPQCLLPILLNFISYVYSWDIALTVGDQLEFRNGSEVLVKSERFGELTALAYDAVYNMLLFVDKQSDNASIFSYHLDTKKYQPLVKRKSYENIQGLAFDPITSQLFWADSNERGIFTKSLKSGAENDNIYGTLLFKTGDKIPRAIAVDSCRGYIYWTNINITNPTIERSKFNGDERKVIVSSGIYMPVSIAIDQRTRTLYWADDKQGIHYSIDRSDLDGGNYKNIVSGIQHQPNTIAVSKDSVYWVDFGYRSVWKLPKDAPSGTVPEELHNYGNELPPFGIVADYGIPDQTEGVPECQGLANLALNKSSINDTFNIPRDLGLFCLHGVKVDGKSCKCSPGYTGERCEFYLCQNYCFDGECTISSDGKPECRCNQGYKGNRCEVDICYGHCLNFGSCTVKDQAPSCACFGDYEGPRCEREIVTTKVPNNAVAKMEPGTCNCTIEHQNTPASTTSPENLTVNDEFVDSCVDGWDPIRDPVIMVLGVMSGLLCMACTFLITKVLKLKKRPRIKKRIIVNKNATPLTARPDQCEITIENCCNMNICETPCFEPRSTIRPTLLDSKPGKEEKKNLIANIEYPDDY